MISRISNALFGNKNTKTTDEKGENNYENRLSLEAYVKEETQRQYRNGSMNLPKNAMMAASNTKS